MKRSSISLLGDSRLEPGFDLLVSRMVVRYTVTLRKLGLNRNEELRFGRFINNPKISPKVLLDQHCSKESNLSGKDVLVISDTSTLSFESHRNRTDLGYVGPNTSKSGFSIHPSLLLDASNGAVQGIGGISIHKASFEEAYSDQEAKDERRKELRGTVFENKKTYKWLDSPKQAINNYPNASSYTLVGDRESDIYDLIDRTLQNNWHFLYRNRANRALSKDHVCSTLHPEVNNWPVKHSYELDLESTKDRTAHAGLMDLKFGEVTITKPVCTKDPDLPKQITLHAVQVKERASTVVGDETPVCWTLLTSHPVTTVDKALQIIQWYLWRWTIEELFRTLKSKGLKIEDSEVESFNALANLTTLALLAACQIMQLVQARDGTSNQNIETVFSAPEQDCLERLNTKLQGKTKKTKNPHPPKSLASASWVIARLGGWSGYKSQRPPGPITMINGLTRFYQTLEGFFMLL